MRDKIAKAREFVTRTAKSTWHNVKSFVVGLARHAETTIILVAASFGVTSLLSEVPFYLWLPMFVESPMFIPVLSVLIVALLATIAEKRAASAASREEAAHATVAA